MIGWSFSRHAQKYDFQQFDFFEKLAMSNKTLVAQVFQHFNIEMEYADDLSKLNSGHNNIRRYEHNVEENLGKKWIKVNKNKTENHTISRQIISGKSVSFSGHFSTPKKISKEERFLR